MNIQPCIFFFQNMEIYDRSMEFPPVINDTINCIEFPPKSGKIPSFRVISRSWERAEHNEFQWELHIELELM